MNFNFHNIMYDEQTFAIHKQKYGKRSLNNEHDYYNVSIPA